LCLAAQNIRNKYIVSTPAQTTFFVGLCNCKTGDIDKNCDY